MGTWFKLPENIFIHVYLCNAGTTKFTGPAGSRPAAAFNKAMLESNSSKTSSCHPGYLGPCSCVGDRFYATMLTPHGGWWEWGHGRQFNKFLQCSAHTGDNVPGYNIGVERFDHHACTGIIMARPCYM